jgi:hypothetical protein
MHAKVSGIARQMVNHASLLIRERVVAAGGSTTQASSHRFLIGHVLTGRDAGWAALS